MSTAEPLVYDFTVNCRPDHAFETWTAKIDRWWPKDHSMSGDSECTIVIEGFVDGRILERASDGTEYDWGRVTLWEPPHKLGYEWFAGGSPTEPTDVEVTFADQGESTFIHLVHSGWERFDTNRDVKREQNRRGWSDTLAAYRRHLG